MGKLSETKQAAARKKILIGVCEEFKEKFGDELDPPIVTKGKTEKQLTAILKEVGPEIEVDDNISKESEEIMVELECLSEAYLKTLSKKSKNKKAKKEPEPEPEKELTKKEKKAAAKAAKAAKKKAEKEAAAKAAKAIAAKKISRIDAICQFVNDDKAEYETLDQLAILGDDLYAKKGGTSNLNESKAVARMVAKVLVHFDIDIPTK
jgi:hypothetical protein